MNKNSLESELLCMTFPISFFFAVIEYHSLPCAPLWCCIMRNWNICKLFPHHQHLQCHIGSQEPHTC